MKLSPFFFPCIISAMMVSASYAKAQPSTSAQQTSLNMIAYENKAAHQYATVLYMPYYPAYGMFSLKSPECNAEIAGYINPFALKNKKLIITYKTCKVSFDISQNNQELNNPTENTACQKYHTKSCSFSQIPSLKRIALGNNP